MGSNASANVCADCLQILPQDGVVVLQIFAPAKCHVTLVGIIGRHAAADTRHDEATRSGTFLRGTLVKNASL